MIKIFTSFFAWFMPILRKAAVQIIAEEINKLVEPHRRRESLRNVSYFYDHPRARPMHNRYGGEFHDVLLIAFDITAPDALAAHEWLMDNMPAVGLGGDNDEINLDSWWIANDERFDRSDTDSAVFVAMGKQEEARALLRENGLAN